jgi:hypothetical protein
MSADGWRPRKRLGSAVVDRTGTGGAPEVLVAAVVEERELGLGVGGEGGAWAAVADVD